jgi:hypothetical protein
MGTSNDTIRLDRQETADLLSILSVHDRSASGRRLSPRIAEILESISLNGTVRLDLTPEPPAPDWAIEQPRDLDPDQGFFPLRYPSGFGHFPISLAFWDGPLRSNLLADGHATLEDLRAVRIGDFGFLGGIEAQVIEARKRVDAILAEKPIPPGGYRRLPSRLTPDMPALSLAEAISDYLPLWRRRTFRLALNVDGNPWQRWRGWPAWPARPRRIRYGPSSGPCRPSMTGARASRD